MFNERYATGLTMFSATHFIVIAVCIVLLAATVCLRKYFASPKADKIFRLTLGSFLLVFETTFHIWTAVRGGYSWNMFPPFGLCALTNLLTMIALFTDNRKIVSVCIYWALCGAFFSIIFVDISYMPPHFRFFHYFLVHFGFALGCLYYVITGKIRPTRKDVNRSSIILLTHSLVIYVLDVIFEQNWLYMREPAIPELSKVISGPLYTIGWILLIAGMIQMWYGLLKLSIRLAKRITSRRATVAAR